MKVKLVCSPNHISAQRHRTNPIAKEILVLSCEACMLWRNAIAVASNTMLQEARIVTSSEKIALLSVSEKKIMELLTETEEINPRKKI